MSRAFLASTDHLDAARALVLAPPMTMLAWVKMTTLGLGYQIMTIGQSGISTQRFSLGYQATNTIGCNENDGASSIAQSSAAIADTTAWHLAVGVWSDRTNRAAFLDGANKGTISALKAAGTPNAVRVSGDLQAVPANPFQGLVGITAVWNVALTDAEVASLLSLYPSQVRPANLVHLHDYSDKQSPEPDYGAGNLPLIVTGAAFNAASPPVSPPALSGGEQRKKKLFLPTQTKGETAEQKRLRRIAQGIEVDAAQLAREAKDAADRADAQRQVEKLKRQIATFQANAQAYRERVLAAEAAAARKLARDNATRASRQASALRAELARLQMQEMEAEQLIEEFDIAVIASMLAEA